MMTRKYVALLLTIIMCICRHISSSSLRIDENALQQDEQQKRKLFSSYHIPDDVRDPEASGSGGADVAVIPPKKKKKGGTQKGTIHAPHLSQIVALYNYLSVSYPSLLQRGNGGKQPG